MLVCGMSIGCPDETRVSSGSSASAPADTSLEGLWAGIYGSDPMDPDPDWDQDDQIVQGIGSPTDGVTRLMMRGRDDDDPLEAVRLYTLRASEVDARDESLSQALLRKTNINYRPRVGLPGVSTFGFIDDNYSTVPWKANLTRMLKGELIQFIPPTAGTIPNMSSGERECTEQKGPGVIDCHYTFSIAQPVPLLTAFQLAGDFYKEGVAGPTLIFVGDVVILPPNNRPSNNGLKGDTFYIGMVGKFTSFLIDIEDATGAGHEGVWEYSHFIVEIDPRDPDDIIRTKSWLPLPGPSPTVFESTGLAFETWEIQPEWDPFVVVPQGDAYHWIRFRTTTGDALPATATRVWVVTHGTPYETASSLALLEGEWERVAGDARIDVAPDGSFDGGDDGPSTCDYEGMFSIVDASKNLYGMTMEVTGCGEFDGTDYSGLAWIGVDPLTGADEEGNLFFHVDNKSHAFGDQLVLQTPVP
jgi:hypothetical protein